MNPVEVIKNERKDIILPACEATYVLNGTSERAFDSLDQNFNDSEILHLKADDGSGHLCRKILLKFDLSAFAGRETTHMELVLNVVGAQSNGGTVLEVYETDPESWDANTVTFRTCPVAGRLIFRTDSAGKGTNVFLISDYLREKMENGAGKVAFLLQGDNKEPLHLQFVSGKKQIENGPRIVASSCTYGFHTDVSCMDGAENAWKNAAEMYEEWKNDWDRIAARGDSDAELLNEDSAEYSLRVKATRSPKIAYRTFATRSMKTLHGFVPDCGEETKLDEYGGLICEEKFQKTGFFHIEKRNGRFWNVDPLGNPFFRKAIVGVSPGSSDHQRERVLSACGTSEKWAEHETKHLRDDLGFNSVGAWSDVEHLARVREPLALCKIVGFVTGYAGSLGMNNSTGGSTTFVGGAIPVFDPDFVRFSEKQAEKAVKPYADNPHFYGWMSDNELHAELRLLDTYLMLDYTNPSFAYSYTAAWTFLREMCGKSSVSIGDVTDEMRKLFRAMIYNRYFRVCREALRKYDENHLYMGCRFLPGCYRDEQVERVAGEWCDVISLNYYGVWQPESELIRDIQKWSGRPFVVTEWYAKGMDACTPKSRLTNESGAGWTCLTQADRAAFYQNYALKLLECRGCVGFDWFKTWDNDPDNLKADLSNRNSNKGIYNNDYEEYTEVTCAMAELNRNAYRLIDYFDSDPSRCCKE